MSEEPSSSTRGALDLAAEVAAGALDSEAHKWLRDGFAAWVRGSGAVPLERCLHLPSTPRKARLARRNYWLIEAARTLGGSNSWGVSVALAAELDDFLSRGAWRTWKDLDAPPEGASQLRTALWHVAKANDGKSLTSRHVSRCVGHIFERKCR